MMFERCKRFCLRDRYLTHNIVEFTQASLFFKICQDIQKIIFNVDYIMNKTCDEVANLILITMRSYYEMQYDQTSTEVSHPPN